MMLILKVALLVGLIRLLISTSKPLLCAGLYTTAIAIAAFMLQAPVQAVAISAGIAFIISFVYFWLLNRFHSGLLYWLFLIIGMPIIFFT